MASGALLSFQSALEQYLGSRSALNPEAGEAAFDQADEISDEALNALLAIPIHSPAEFAEKMRILELEYGLDAQPRHIAAIYADARILAAF